MQAIHWGVDMRRPTLALAGLFACVLCAGAMNVNAATSSQQRALSLLGSRIGTYQRATWHWQRLMGVRRSPTTGDSVAELGVEGAKRALVRWRRLARVSRRRAQHPPHLAQFLCIHRYEGSWRDSGAPFWGGLQMNWGFQAAYGGWLLRTKGTADHWTPLEQLWVAEKALRIRGFWPWPNTARYCGLI
jgi:hypothetical protein